MAQGIVEQSSRENEQQQKRQRAPVGERARLIQRLLDAAGDLPTFLTDLLATQAVTVVGTEAAAFLVERITTDAQGNPAVAFKDVAHIRPDESDAQTRAAALKAFKELIVRCVVEGKDGAIQVGPANQDNEPQYCLITLLRDGAEIVAVSAVVTRCRNDDLSRQRLSSMQLVAGYFEFFALRRAAEASKYVAVSHQRVLQLNRAVADAEGFQAATMNLCNELANATGATRVSMGWLKGVQGRTIRVVALSHTEEFDKKQELVVQLEKVMEECYDQEGPVLYLPAAKVGAGLPTVTDVSGTAIIPASRPDPEVLPATDAVTRQAAILSRGQGGHVVLSLPLRRHADIEGVVTLEFLSADGLTSKLMESLTLAVDLLAPQLFDRFENDRWLITKAGLSARYWAEELVGPRHWVAKLISIGVAILLLLLTNFFNIPAHVGWLAWADIRPTYHVSAQTTFEATDKRSICAPFDGQIGQVWIRPGEPVKKGAKLFSMKTDEQYKQYLKSYSEAISHQLKADAARTDPTKIAEVAVEMAQRDASMAEADYYKWQVDHGTIYAPMDGQILTAKGDLTDKVDVEVKQGEEQMVFGNPDSLRADLQVADRDIQDVTEGQRGTLATTSEPTHKVPFTISRVVPLGAPKESANVFTVYATPDKDKVAAGWRPGMSGEARIDVGKRTYLWWWTHRLVDFVRLKVWM
jgi:hypothetical protein